MSLEIHRDIYSGIVAEELNKGGYFGKECEFYGFLCAANGIIDLQSAVTEEECAQEYLKKIQQGYLLSPYTLVKQRFYQELSISEIQKILTELLHSKLQKKYLMDLQLNISKQHAKEIMLLNEVQEYLSGLSKEQIIKKRLPIALLLGQLLSKGQISKQQYQQLRDSLPPLDSQVEETTAKQYYGFAYQNAEKWMFYANAYLPAVLNKWLEYTAQGVVVSALARKSYNPLDKWYQIKDDLISFLQEVLDSRFLKLNVRVFSLD